MKILLCIGAKGGLTFQTWIALDSRKFLRLDFTFKPCLWGKVAENQPGFSQYKLAWIQSKFPNLEADGFVQFSWLEWLFLLECKNRLFLELSYGVWDQTLSWKWSYLVSLLSKDLNLIFFALWISSLMSSHQLLENVCFVCSRDTLVEGFGFCSVSQHGRRMIIEDLNSIVFSWPRWFPAFEWAWPLTHLFQ